MSWTIRYHSVAVQDDIRRWPVRLQAGYVRITDLMQREGPDLGMPYTRAMGRGLFEIRCQSHKGLGRVFFAARPGGRIVMLHSLLKKTPKTPPRELALAYRRLREVIREERRQAKGP